MSAASEPLTVEDLRQRVTITMREYAAFVGVSKDTAYQAAARGELKVLHLGRRVLVPTAPVLESLGLAAGAGCHGCHE